MNGILKGLRIIEGSAFIAAPSAGMAMAQMGADVIRFDPIGGGLDYTRWPVTEKGDSLYWASLNKGKRSVVVDIKSPKGRELITSLICMPGDENGIFITNFPAVGWMGYESLKKRREDLIMVNIKGNRDGTSEVDYTVNPATGFPSLTGPKNGSDPVNHVLPAWDIATGLSAVNGLLAAERYRRIRGEGQLISIALSDVAFSTLGNLGFIAEKQVLNKARSAGGNELFGAFGRDFLTRDHRRIMIVAITQRQWRALVKTMKLEQAVSEIEARTQLDLSREGDRYMVTEEIAALIAPWCAGSDLSTLSRQLTEGGVSWGPYRTVSEALDEDLRCSIDNPMFEVIEQPGIGKYLTPGSPLDFSGVGKQPVQCAPALGQDTDEVLMKLLGLSEGQIGKLHDEGIIFGP